MYTQFQLREVEPPFPLSSPKLFGEAAKEESSDKVLGMKLDLESSCSRCCSFD
jgi:hypothetical protein